MSRRLEIVWKWGVVALCLGLLGGGLYLADRYIPAQHLPWKTLDTSRPLGWATRQQITTLSLAPSSVCAAVARDADGFSSLPADPKRPTTGAGAGTCGWDVARLVYGTEDVNFAPGESHMQCPLAVGTYLWQREIDALAQKHFGQGLAKIHHMGTYSCRRQVGNGSGKWSEHAFANAWDVAAFELADGTLIRILSDWDGARARANFLREARDAACQIFRVTLSPDYNAAHADHFHLDMGPSKSCR